MRSAMQFSGGKDSLAVLHLMRGKFDTDTTVYFGDTGIAYPHMVEFIQRTCAELGLSLKLVAPPVPIGQFHAARGLPSDIVPIEATMDMQAYLRAPRGTLLQSGLTCCSAMLWRPLQEAMVADGIKTVYRGSKKCDGHVGVGDGFVDSNGIVYRSPIWDWSDAEVFSYLKDEGVELPRHYAAVNGSFDCFTRSSRQPQRHSRAMWARPTRP